VLEAVGSPGLGLKPFFFDGPAIDQTLTERSIIDALQSILHLRQKSRIGIRFSELLTLLLVDGCFVRPVPGSRFGHAAAFFGAAYPRQ